MAPPLPLYVGGEFNTSNFTFEIIPTLLQQAIYAKIVEIVERFPEGSKPKYRQAAQKFRLPYLDYYRPRGRRTTVFPGVRPGGSTSFNYDFSVPQIFLLEQVMVRTPPRDELTLFPNPLNSYRFPAQGSIPPNQWSIVGADVRIKRASFIITAFNNCDRLPPSRECEQQDTQQHETR